MTPDELLALAEKATRGPWVVNKEHDPINVYAERGTITLFDMLAPRSNPSAMADADFIAACSPERIVSLIRRCREAEAVVRVAADIEEDTFVDDANDESFTVRSDYCEALIAAVVAWKETHAV